MPFLPSLILIALTAASLYVFARQLGNPSGWFGRRLMPSFLNRSNRAMIDAAIGALAAKAGERIVDVGFRGGYALELLAPLVSPARVVGVELSDAMLDAARQRWGETIELHRADARAMPFGDASFDGIVSVNTIYFWADPAAVLREFRRVLKQIGRAH